MPASVGITSVGPASVGIASVGITSVGPASVGIASIGITSVGSASVGPASVIFSVLCDTVILPVEEESGEV